MQIDAIARLKWFVSSLLGYGGAMLVASIIPYFSEILGLIASLITSQVSVIFLLIMIAHQYMFRPRWHGPHTR